MSTSISASPIWTSPRFDRRAERRLSGSVVQCAGLTSDDRNRMYGLLAAYFVGTTREGFDRDLAEKEAVVLLRDRESGEIHGFSSLMRLRETIEGREVVAFFSGDTIIAQEYWGETLLSRLWSQSVFADADRIRAERPDASVYWFLICSGYKTWRFLPVFFRQFYPHPGHTVPPEIKRIMDTLGNRKFGQQYLPENGVVRFQAATPLRSGVADVTAKRLRDPWIAFFNHANPGHAKGDELACLAEVSRSNLTRAGERMVGSRLCQDGRL